MKIKPSQKRIEFERLLIDLGFRDRSPVQTKFEKKFVEILKCLTKNKIKVKGFAIEYKNKKSYLYEFFILNYKELNINEMREQILLIAKDIRFKEKTRIGEVGWRIENAIYLGFWSKKDRLDLYFSFLKLAPILLKYGDGIGINPRPGDILVSKPEGSKFGALNHPVAIKMGADQRSHINKKLGFGLMKTNNSQYAIYDENLNLNPI
jgi:hypothetical protein